MFFSSTIQLNSSKNLIDIKREFYIIKNLNGMILLKNNIINSKNVSFYLLKIKILINS